MEDLENINLFSEFSDDEINIVKRYFNIRDFRKDDIIIKRDEIKKEFFIILKGKAVSTLKIPGRGERKHSEFCEGDFFGEASFFGNKPSFDTYTAAEDSLLLTITESDLTKLIEDDSDVAVKLIYRILSLIIQRLKDTSQFLADVVQWGEEASKRAITDDMTGVYNRAFLEDAMLSFFNIPRSSGLLPCFSCWVSSSAAGFILYSLFSFSISWLTTRPSSTRVSVNIWLISSPFSQRWA
ncbi:MAG: cyclic nucleotide-binding domain-containing protein [Spirochaetes bacterium]|nr:cyclic nucleotide-binding domain-containing protein [Spirochaetota bacterium]